MGMVLPSIFVAQLPAQPLPIPGTTDVLFQPDPVGVSELVAELVPFPVGAPPGSRLRAAEQRYQQLDPQQREDLRRQWERMSESERERYRQRIERND